MYIEHRGSDGLRAPREAKGGLRPLLRNVMNGIKK